MQPRFHRLFTSILLLAGLLQTNQAADRYWDGTSTTADADGGTGTWNTTATNLNWDDAETAGNAVFFANGDNVFLGGTAGTVTFAAAPNSGTMEITTPGYIFRGYANGSSTHTGLTALPTSGTTTFNQNANNHSFRFNGGVNLNGSELAIRLRNTLNGGSPSTIIGPVTGSGTVYLTNELSGANNTARLVLSGSNSYGGTTRIDGAILDANSSTALGNSTLQVESTITGITTVLRNTSAGALTWTNNNPMLWNGDFAFGADTARSGTSSGTCRDLNTGTGAVTLGGNRTINVTSNTLTVGGVIGDGGGAYGITKAGAGTLALTAANTYTGNTTVNTGTLSLGDGTATSGLADSSSVAIGGTGVLNLNFTGTDVVDKLFINGIQKGSGTWGSSASAAANVDDTRFAGTGTLTVTSSVDPLIVADSPVAVTTHNAATPITIPVSNGGASQTLTISAVNFTGANAADFTLTSTLPVNILPGSSGAVDCSFNPSAGPGSYTATVEITSNDTSQSPKSVTLNVTNNPDPWLQVAATTNFTNDGTAFNYTIPIGNIGNAQSLNLSAVTKGGADEAFVSNITFPASVPAGGSGDIGFLFTPVNAGPYEFTLTIASNQPGTPSREITVKIDVRDPVISVATTPINFGILANQPGLVTQSVTVLNDGGSRDLEISAINFTGDPEFSVTNTLPLSIPAGGSADLVVQFAPGTAIGRKRATMAVISNDSTLATPTLSLLAFVEPAQPVVARFNFDPSALSGTRADADESAQADWTTTDLVDQATGVGALSSGNQTTANRELGSGSNGNYLRLSCAREADAQTPVLAGGGNESTWFTFDVNPDIGGGSINFTGGSAVMDTFAFATGVAGTTAANWTLYYSADAGATWTSLGTAVGASLAADGAAGPLGIAWDLTTIGVRTGPVRFAIDAVSTGASNGTAAQRSVGFDNLVVSAGSITPGANNFDSWAAANNVTGGANGDSDNDGIGNLVEYALDLNPAASDGAAGSFDGATRVLTFAKRAEALANGDVTYAIQTSATLAPDSWATVTPDVNNATTISYTLPNGQGRLFARLVVSQIVP
jgi:autotransporter-associated beta strand protein